MISADSFSSESPIWIYQSDRVFTNVECDQITKELKSFITQWTSHGQKLKAEAHIFHNIFIVFIVESTVELPSGCSIDSSVHLVKELEKSLRIDFFNRLNICYRSDDQLYIHSLSEIKKAAKIGTITAETTMFDNSIQTFGNWLDGWEKPIGETWLKKIF